MTPIDSNPEDEWLRLVREAVAMPDAPPQLLQSTLELWRTHGARPSASGALRRWIAALSFDSWSAPALAAGVRALPSEVRHLLFTTHGRDVDLRIAPLADGFALSGQHLGPDDAGHVALTWLAGSGEPPARQDAALNAMGEFRLEGVRQGTYLLTVLLGDDEIVLPPIDVGPAAERGAP
jgi:hypothetical protein